MIIIPIMVIILLEFVLRWTWDEDRELDVFVQDPYASDYYVVNQSAGKRYFSGNRFGAFGTQDVFLKKKLENGLRIFVFGGSSTAGYPYLFSGSFPAMIQQRLEALYPEKSIEVINLGMTAVNSFTIKDFARDALRFDPDMFIIYAGHNEFYGALGSASSQGSFLSGHRTFTQLYLHLKNTSTYRFILTVMQKLTAGDATKSGQTLMARMVGNHHIPYDSALYQRTHQVFSANIQEILDDCKQSGIPVLIGSLSSNIRDQKPFVSILVEGVDSTEFARELEAIKDNMVLGNFEEAMESLTTMMERHPHHALLNFYAGRCQEFLGNSVNAQSYYTSARDFDGLRFRASSDMNEVIRDLCERNTNAYYAPVHEHFIEEASKGLVGKSHFLEHLHPHARGYFSMAKTYTGLIRELVPSGESSKEHLDSLLLSDIALSALDSSMAKMRVDMLTSGWPFRETKRFLTVDQIHPESFTDQLALSVLKKDTDYEKAHVELAQHYVKNGQWKQAVNEYRILAHTFRNNESPLMAASRLLIQNEQFDAALPYLHKTLNLVEDGYSYKWIGTILLFNQDPHSAIPYFKKAIKSSPRDEQLLYNLAGAYYVTSQPGLAKNTLNTLLRINPQNQDASRLLRKISQVDS